MQSKNRRVEPPEADEEEFIPSADQEDSSDLESRDESVTRSPVKYSQNKEELMTKHFE